MAFTAARSRHTLLLRWLLGLLAMALLTLAASLVFWQQFKREQGIRELDWQGLQLQSGQLYLQQLTLLREEAGGLLSVQAERLQLHWRLIGGARLESLETARLALDWQPAAEIDDNASAPLQLSRPDPRELLPDWLPRRLTIEQLQLELPCPAGRCALQGRLALQQGGAPDAPTAVQLSLLHQDHQLDFDAQVSGPADQVDLWARVRIDDQPRLGLTSVYRAGLTDAAWSGQLELPELPEAPWLVAWLEQWSGPQPRLQDTGELQLQADWDWQLTPGRLDAALLRSATGHINLQAELPGPWPIPGIGQLGGKAAVQLRADAGRWTASQLHADLQLQQLAPERLAALPSGLQPSSLHLRVQQRDASEAPATELPLRVHLTSSGALQLDLQGDMRLTLARDWALRWDHARLQAKAARLQLAALDARTLRLDVRLSGQLAADAFAATLDPASSLTVDELTLANQAEPLRVDGLQLDRSALTASGSLLADAIAYDVRGTARLRARQLKHPAVQPLDWTWDGEVQASPAQQQATGTLANGAGLSARVQLNRSAEAVQIGVSLPESFLRSGNPLAATFSAWPDLLELGSGRVQLDAELELPATGELRAQAEARIKGAAGLYDRTEFSGLTAQLQGRIESQRLHLQVSDLKLEQVNPGFVIGPLQFTGNYRAPLADPAAGQLDWRLARSGLLGGEIWLDPGSLRLDQAGVLPVHLRGLQLQELFSAYPAEGLSGHGTLDGELPVGFGPDGIRILGGRLAAREPGQLQFRSPKISALGRSNPAMQVVAEALEDFHYDLLSSGVDYDAQGTLRLGLKLAGRNPNVERGRPINFNINLEEDIPALLTSLQLTGKVSERVRERVQQHLEQSRSTP